MFPATMRYVEILEAAYLPNMPVKITEVALTKQAKGPLGPSFTAQQFQVRMSHTSVTCPRSVQFSAWSGPCPIELINTTTGFTYTPVLNQWHPVGTVGDFGYDGKRNICLEIRYRGQGRPTLMFLHSGDNKVTKPISRLWAEGFADNYASLVGDKADCDEGLMVCLSYTNTCILLAPDTVKVGASMTVSLLNMPAGDLYQIAASFGQNPMNLGKCTLFLDPDGLFFASIFGVPIFSGYVGTVPAGGNASGKVTVPKIPALAGICIYHAAVAYNKNGIDCCTNTAGTKIVP